MDYAAKIAKLNKDLSRAFAKGEAARVQAILAEIEATEAAWLAA